MGIQGKGSQLTNITIIGTGLIGTSLGLAIKKAGIKDLRITGHDRDSGHTRTAAKMGALDASESNLPKAVKDADVVIIATPVMAIKEVMGQIAEHLKDGCIVTDTGSTKQQVLEWARELLPARVSFVGGHPMAGKELSGPSAATATLFQGAAYVIIPDPKAANDAAKVVTQLAESAGARPFYVNAQEHDAFVAGVSHLPLVVASVLMLAVAKSPAWPEMARLAAGGLRDTTRLASGEPIMSRDLTVTNSAEILPWIDRFIAEMMEFRRSLLADNVAEVQHHYEWVQERRDRWVGGAELAPRNQATIEVPGASEQMAGMLMGDALARKTKEFMDQYGKDDKGKKPN
ncbi:MAG: Prephenate dehydrogenase [Dehalococcoidia bacterium]|nr:Prephenate dehydrogenase [Dehalococcoidia bacterium]